MGNVSISRKGGAWVAVLLSLVICLRLFYGIVGASDRPYPGLTLKQDLIVSVAPDGPGHAAGLRSGDRIIQIDGIPFLEPLNQNRLAFLAPSKSITLLIRRDHGLFRVAMHGALPPRPEVLWRTSLGFSGLLLLAFGLFVLSRRRDRQGLLFFLICYVFAFLARPPLPEELSWIFSLESAAYDFAQVFLPPLLLHFFLIFPEESSILARLPDRKAGSIQTALYLPSTVIFAASQVFVSAKAQPVIQSIVAIYLVASIIAALSLFIRSYRVSHLLRQRRLKVAILGTVAAILPVTVVTLLLNLFPGADFPAARYSYLFLLLLPVSFSYAIVRYHFFDIELMIKRGILYSLLTTFIAAIYLGTIWGVNRLFRQLTGQGNILLTVLSTLIIAVLFMPVRNRLQSLVDRIFFKERHDHVKTIRELSHFLAKLADRESLAELLVHRVPASFRSEFTVLLARKGKWFKLTRLTGKTGHFDGAFSLTESVAGSLRGSHEAAAIEKMESGRMGSFFPAADVTPIRNSRASLLLPVYARGKPELILMIGPRLSGEPYNAEDLEFLATISEQASMSLENSLHAQDRVEKEQMDVELSLAREIQMSLHPKEAPQSESFDIYGATLPSGSIGGDCLDFIRLSTSKIAVAVGDVCGKGVPAALLAAGVQAALRSEAERNASPVSVLDSVNRRLLLLERPDKFAGMVYAVFDGDKREVIYSNAGLNAPFLLRESGNVERLETGGTILGISEGSIYQQARLSIDPGDLFIFFTDGVVEQMNHMAEYGEERMLEVISRNRSLPSRQLAKAVLESLNLFSGETQDDDVSLVVVRVLPLH